MLSSIKHLLFNHVFNVLLQQQQQSGLPWWAWFLLIVVVIFLFVLLWRWLGLAREGVRPVDTPFAAEEKPQAKP